MEIKEEKEKEDVEDEEEKFLSTLAPYIGLVKVTAWK